MAVSFIDGDGLAAEDVDELTSPAFTVSGSERAVIAGAISSFTDAIACQDCKVGGSGGVSLSKVSADHTSDVGIANVWSLPAPAAGSPTAWCTFASAAEPPRFSELLMVALDGVDQTTPLANLVSASDIFDGTGGGNATVNVDTSTAPPGSKVLGFLYLRTGDLGACTLTPAGGGSQLGPTIAPPADEFNVIAFMRDVTGSSTPATVDVAGTNGTGTGWWHVIAGVVQAPPGPPHQRVVVRPIRPRPFAPGLAR